MRSNNATRPGGILLPGQLDALDLDQPRQIERLLVDRLQDLDDRGLPVGILEVSLQGSRAPSWVGASASASR
jgi:hypothetical protein